MSLTLDEIVENQDRLRREIMERECLLAAFNVLHGYMASGRAPRSIELGSLVSALSPAAPALALREAPATLPPLPPAPDELPPPAPVPRYIHPDLAPFRNQHGGNTNAVSWAIKRMTNDYSLRDLCALLNREGYAIRPDQISVVLNRMSRYGLIEESKFGYGPNPTIFRKPESALPSEASPDHPAPEAEPATALAASA